jgi:hypothetical protein
VYVKKSLGSVIGRRNRLPHLDKASSYSTVGQAVSPVERLFTHTGRELTVQRTPILTDERINDAHAGVREIRTVSRGDCQAVDGRRRRDEAIFDRHGFPGSAKTGQRLRPFQAGIRVPGQKVETPNSRIEPAFESSPLLPLGRMRIPGGTWPRSEHRL